MRALEMDPDELINQAAAYNQRARMPRLDLARIRGAIDYLLACTTTQRGEDDDERKQPTRNYDHFID